MLNVIINNIENNDIHTNKLGLARSILAIGTFITIIFNNPYELMNPMGIYDNFTANLYYAPFNYFLIFKDSPSVAFYLAIVGLLAVISGYFQSLTSIFYWWLAFSVSSFGLIEGGDQITSILAFLLIPICMTDIRKNHWQKSIINTSTNKKIYNSIANLSRYVIVLQICVLYFVASTAKFNTPQWVNGTAIYYWLNHNMFGVNDFLLKPVNYLLHIDWFIFASSWFILLIELLLSVSFLFNPPLKKIMLFTGIGLHFGIAVFHGLISFAFAMTGALILYISSLHKNI